ncbi:PIN domain-containing protein [Actinoplanes oblitus]|uniref:PIN domain-containing protein n=1 Tax=Actinoplanes oblitus TaxID=3040509 RepID=A0ABY8WQD2_9ACTN|nr:PIN domain-containing protein [Actinoplanes oblitus]WIN00107.1 PIN domain-containing protein [Actinoplanes oblitus]
MKFQAGVRLADADEVLRRAETCWTNVAGGSKSYQDAVAESYPQLRQTFISPDLATGMRSDGYWHLLENTRTASTAASARERAEKMRALNDAFRMEIDQQRDALGKARTELDALKMLAGRPGLPVVIDTNILIVWKSPDQIDWRETLREQGESITQARIIVPLRVVDELDRQKDGDGKLLPGRAATAIRFLERTFSGTAAGEAVPLRHGSTLEIWTASDERGLDADLTILRCAADIAALNPEVGVRVLTGDFGMRLRAGQMSLPVLGLPADRFRK